MRVIAGQARGRRLKAPRGLLTRPTSARVRESIFSRLAVRLGLEGIRVLDVFAGSGSLGLEALSRGAASAVFIDSSRAAARAIESNLAALGLRERARVMASDVRRALAQLGAQQARFELVFIDAPYKNDISAQVLELTAQRELVARGGCVVVRQSTRAPAPPPAPADFERAIVTIGEHRIAYYRLHLPAPGEG
jgi:16S rRNA (guanine966-N2)-methyltransferase